MSMDNQEITPNLSAAFDTIDHQILLSVLENDFQIIGSALTWFPSYLATESNGFSSMILFLMNFNYIAVSHKAAVWVLFCSCYTSPDSITYRIYSNKRRPRISAALD